MFIKNISAKLLFILFSLLYYVIVPAKAEESIPLSSMTDEELIYNQCIYTRDGSPTHEAKKSGHWMWDTMSKCKTYTKIPPKSDKALVVNEKALVVDENEKNLKKLYSLIMNNKDILKSKYIKISNKQEKITIPVNFKNNNYRRSMTLAVYLNYENVLNQIESDPNFTDLGRLAYGWEGAKEMYKDVTIENFGFQAIEDCERKALQLKLSGGKCMFVDFRKFTGSKDYPPEYINYLLGDFKVREQKILVANKKKIEAIKEQENIKKIAEEKRIKEEKLALEKKIKNEKKKEDEKLKLEEKIKQLEDEKKLLEEQIIVQENKFNLNLIFDIKLLSLLLIFIIIILTVKFLNIQNIGEKFIQWNKRRIKRKKEAELIKKKALAKAIKENEKLFKDDSWRKELGLDGDSPGSKSSKKDSNKTWWNSMSPLKQKTFLWAMGSMGFIIFLSIIGSVGNNSGRGYKSDYLVNYRTTIRYGQPYVMCTYQSGKKTYVKYFMDGSNHRWKNWGCKDDLNN